MNVLAWLLDLTGVLLIGRGLLLLAQVAGQDVPLAPEAMPSVLTGLALLGVAAVMNLGAGR